jgi:acetyltransferase-like isoleucine patch superfamily enzyme
MTIKRIIKLWYFRVKYFSKRVSISNGCDISLKSKFEGCNTIKKNTVFAGTLGFGSYIAENSIITGQIGRYCSISMGVKVLSGTHPLKNFVSTSPVFYSTLKQNNTTYVKKQCFNEFLFADENKQFTIIIGNDVWIGDDAILIGGIHIGDGAVVLANATVTKDIPPYSIVGGVPAKIIGTRFDEETIDFLLKFKWWAKSPIWLMENSHCFSNIIEFKDKFKDK